MTEEFQPLPVPLFHLSVFPGILRLVINRDGGEGGKKNLKKNGKKFPKKPKPVGKQKKKGNLK